eukprot:6251401-Amphidinium_carterae.1
MPTTVPSNLSGSSSADRRSLALYPQSSLQGVSYGSIPVASTIDMRVLLSTLLERFGLSLDVRNNLGASHKRPVGMR